LRQLAATQMREHSQHIWMAAYGVIGVAVGALVPNQIVAVVGVLNGDQLLPVAVGGLVLLGYTAVTVVLALLIAPRRDGS
jgi:hypothetical protein